jgi:L-aspartate oxidase
MTTGAGVVRSAEGLEGCASLIARTLSQLDPAAEDTATSELRNLAQIGRVLVAAAIARTESRGTHARVDFPDTDPAQRHRQVVRMTPR